MQLTRLIVQRFRNHTETTLDCNPGINLLLGGNGEGKTNILEGISYLCLGRSFYGASDRAVMQMGTEEFRVEGSLTSDGGVRYTVRTQVDRTTGIKRTTIGGAEIAKRADLIGRFPVVVLSPENGAITGGTPGDRRKFLDLTLSQAGRAYLEDLLEYRRALRQRNRLLGEAKLGRTIPEDLEPWTEILIERGSKIALRRHRFVEEFRPHIQKAFATIVGEQEAPGVSYRSSPFPADSTSEASIAAALRLEFQTTERDEQRSGSTLVGPHRDDLELTINNMSVREFASQGQQKTFLVGLKMAEFSYLHDRCNERPLLLLDDVFSELDEYRCEKVIQFVGTTGQVFVTATDERLVPEHGAERARFDVWKGTVKQRESHVASA